jgi:hypothetical protein
VDDAILTIPVLAVSLGTIAALLGAWGLVGWQRWRRERDDVARTRARRRALANYIVEVVTPSQGSRAR